MGSVGRSKSGGLGMGAGVPLLAACAALITLSGIGGGAEDTCSDPGHGEVSRSQEVSE